MNFQTIEDANFKNFASGKTIVLRVDINLPMQSGFVSDKTRLVNIIPTIKYLQDIGCKIVLISHFGRPKNGVESQYSLRQILPTIEAEIGVGIQFCDDVLKASSKCANLQNGEVILLENLRFYKEEEQNDEAFAKQIASYGQIFVNDAFGCSHRKHASIDAITKFLPSYAGLLLTNEIKNAETILKSKEDIICLVGGSKISTKIELLKSLVKKAKYIAIGGGMANTFYYAQGFSVGRSLCEVDFKSTAIEILHSAKQNGCQIILPQQVFTTKNIANASGCAVKNINNIDSDDIIVDIAFEALAEIASAIEKTKIVVWNGPFGVFEKAPFNNGTEAIARIIAASTLQKKVYSIVGGGDVVSALQQSCLSNCVSYISTGGGSFLEYLENGSLPGVEALKDVANK